MCVVFFTKNLLRNKITKPTKSSQKYFEKKYFCVILTVNSIFAKDVGV